MSTAQFTSVPPADCSWSVCGRFLWKEMRVLRGFVAGVALLTLGVMLVCRWFAPATALPVWLLLTVVGGAAFLAIGSSITAFAVEREERTLDFLHTLPRNWVATLVGKLTATVLVVFLFAVAMSLAAWCVAGGHWPNAASRQMIAGHGAVLVVEAIVWGLFFSLVCPHPLLAAVLACAATSLHIQVAVMISVPNATGLRLHEFAAAVPMRLALASLVMGANAWFARRWVLHTPGRTAKPKQRRWKLSSPTTHSPADESSAAPRSANAASARSHLELARVAIAAPTRRAILARLIWQTLRESWQAMLAVVLVGALLMTTTELLLYHFVRPNINGYLPISLLFLPALCGAMAFRNDQRRRQYRFLAEHAGRPHLAWFARLSIWGGLVLLLFVPASLALLAGGGRILVEQFQALHRQSGFLEGYRWTTSIQALMQVRGADLLYYGLLATILAAWAAFAAGQLASLLLRSEILAAGAALLAAIAILLFCYLMVLWRLPPAWGLGPLALGALVATWIRAPDWLIDRHTRRRWACVAISVVAPLLFVLGTVASVRLRQVDMAQQRLQTTYLTMPLSEQVAAHRRAMEDAESATQQYQVLVRSILEEDRSDESLRDASEVHSGVVSRIAVLGHPAEVEQISNLTLQPAVRLTGSIDWTYEVTDILMADMQRAIAEDDLDVALERYLALIRFAAQLAYNDGLHADWTATVQNPQTSVVVAPELLLEWATSSGQTPERLKSAIEAIRAAERHFPPLGQIIIGDYLHTCDVVAGRDVPEFTHRWSHKAAASDETKLYERLAVVLNELPWERQRALLALGVLASLSLDDVAAIADGHFNAAQIRSRLSSFGRFDHVTLNRNSVEQERERFFSLRSAESSLLTALLWGRGTWMDSYLRQRLMFRTGLALERVRLALIAYQLDNGSYPDLLVQLVPEYANRLDADQFADNMFQFERYGFDSPIRSYNGPHSFSYVPDVPKHTPVIWTVGPDFVAPTEQQQELSDIYGQFNTVDEIESGYETVALFVPSSGWMSSTIVLPLPPSDDAAAE